MTPPIAPRRERIADVRNARHAVAATPDDPWAHVALAHALIQAHGQTHRLIGRPAAEAARHADAAVRLAPDAAWTHHAVGTVALARGANRRAQASLRAGLALDPVSAGLHNDLGVALERQGLKREAVHAYGTASQLDPEDSLAHDNARRAVGAKIGIGVIIVLQLTRLVPGDRLEAMLDGIPLLILVAGAIATFFGVRALLLRARRRRLVLPRADREVMRRLERAQRQEMLSIRSREAALAAALVLVIAGAVLALALI